MLKYNAASMISKIRDSVNKMIVSELEKNGVEGIVSSHGDILSLLYRVDGISVKVLAEKIHRTQPTVSVLVDKLEKLGYVERRKSEEDSRVTLVALTKKGQTLEPIFAKVSEELNELLYGGLTDDEKELFESLLERVFQRF
ncbi:MarR family transcriptional regulator [Brevibacillus fluminis]|uniref:MarR family transcriptional regulator n=1 Tax=Brevibacillus fluminis TaxID=511487 RepID=A0A3M8CVT2_9BACL|nr:MarR family transcriptional regulator [Brevibacillus fluminis]